MMFGDLGHGFILLLVALAFVALEKKWQKEGLPTDMLEIPFAGRYALIVMAIFGMYAGVLYNEFLSLPMNFGSM